MLGSVAGQYEMKVPVLHIEGSKKFFMLHENHTQECEFSRNPTKTCDCGGTRRYTFDPATGNPHIMDCDKLVVLRTETVLQSLFYKPPRKKRK